MVLSLVLAGCSDSGDDGGGSSSDMAQLTIDVTETGWHGETVSVDTRTGETLESLKATYAKEWDFQSISEADITALDASVSAESPNTPLWTYNSTTKIYSCSAAISGSLKGGADGNTELTLTEGLTFSSVNATNFHIVNGDTRKLIQMGGTNQVLTIPNLKAGQKITINFSSANNDARTLTPSNLTETTGFEAASESTTQEGKGTVTANGAVTFTSSEGPINIYSIKVSRAVDEGFGVFGVGLLGSGAQRLVLWNSSTGQWDAGERIYWKRTSSDESFNIYAYAPYKSDAGNYNVNTGVLTFTANDDNAHNTDLLYAGTSVKRSDGLAKLTFKHALAKISLGTITNSSGSNMSLSQVTLTGNLHKSGNLNTMDGTWSGLTAYYSTSKTFTIDIDTNSSEPGNQPLAIDDNTIADIPVEPFLLLPGPTVTITMNFSNGETFSFNTTLEQGKDKTYNITVRKNFEVVITN